MVRNDGVASETAGICRSIKRGDEVKKRRGHWQCHVRAEDVAVLARRRSGAVAVLWADGARAEDGGGLDEALGRGPEVEGRVAGSEKKDGMGKRSVCVNASIPI